jgi:hypothetical protein
MIPNYYSVMKVASAKSLPVSTTSSSSPIFSFKLGAVVGEY